MFLFEGAPNAFAMPGGVIGVTKSLLELLSNEAELVAILGHGIDDIPTIQHHRKIKKFPSIIAQQK